MLEGFLSLGQVDASLKASHHAVTSFLFLPAFGNLTDLAEHFGSQARHLFHVLHDVVHLRLEIRISLKSSLHLG